jgi:hypothetical protein
MVGHLLLPDFQFQLPGAVADEVIARQNHAITIRDRLSARRLQEKLKYKKKRISAISLHYLSRNCARMGHGRNM